MTDELCICSKMENICVITSVSEKSSVRLIISTIKILYKTKKEITHNHVCCRITSEVSKCCLKLPQLFYFEQHFSTLEVIRHPPRAGEHVFYFISPRQQN